MVFLVSLLSFDIFGFKGLYALDLPFGKHQTNHFDEDGYKKISEIVLEELKSKYNF